MTDKEDVAPLTAEWFGARLEALDLTTGFAIAVSGGRDSMALARLSAAYARKTGARVLALTVDHGLRPESVKEAAQAAAWCEAAGLEHRLLHWDGDKPASGVQDAARRARYGLLVRAAEEAEFDALLTAHSADDQAETLFMRLARGAGPQGLAAMAEESSIAAGAGAPIRLLRPLLTVSRAAMTATVESFDQPYADDPGNDDPVFERVRTRALLAALEQQGLLTRAALLKTASRMADATQRMKAREEALFQNLNGCFYRWGGASLDEAATQDRMLNELSALGRRLIFAVSGQDYAPELEAAAEALDKCLKTGAATLGGALLKIHGGRLWFLREPSALLGRTGVDPAGRTPLAAGTRILWDNRFIVTSGTGERRLEIGPADAQTPTVAPFGGPREGFLIAPGVFRDGALIAAPWGLSIGQVDIRFQSLCRERFGGGIVRFA